MIAELFEEILSTIFRNSNEKTTYFADLKEEIKFKFISNSLVFLNCFGYVKHSSLPICGLAVGAGGIRAVVGSGFV